MNGGNIYVSPDMVPRNNKIGKGKLKDMEDGL